MKVWRLEDAHGHGAYASTWEHDPIGALLGITDMGNGPMGPVPDKDGMRVRDGWLYGFKSPEQLRAWFGSDAAPLEDLDLWVSVYNVPESSVECGGHQVSFDPSQALRLSRLSVAEVLSQEVSA